MNYEGSQQTTETRGYMSGFGNSFETEALPGTLPVGRNSPLSAVPMVFMPSNFPGLLSPRRAALTNARGSIASVLR